MNQLLAGGAALVLMAVLWTLGRRPGKVLLRSTDAASVAAINRAQLGVVETVLTKEDGTSPAEPGKVKIAAVQFEPPAGVSERIALERQLRQAMDQGDPLLRLDAIVTAGAWGHGNVLPLLRRGLRDADSRVVEAAAAAIARHRGATKLPAIQAARPPRNVARMR